MKNPPSNMGNGIFFAHEKYPKLLIKIYNNGKFDVIYDQFKQTPLSGTYTGVIPS